MADVPLLHHVHDYLVHYARARGEEEAVVCGDERLTYTELLRRVRACAAALGAAGIRPGDRVATLCDMQLEYLILFLATSMVGAVWMGLNPRYRAQELEHILVDAGPRILFTLTRVPARDLAGDVRGLVAKATTIERVVALDADESGSGFETFPAFLASGSDLDAVELRAMARSGRDPVLLVYTSGTTGRSKGALLTHEGLIARAMTQNRMWPCAPIRVINYLPINHIGGVGFISLYCLVAGGTQFLNERFDPDQFLAQMQRERITIWIGLPTIFLMALERLAVTDMRVPDLQWVISSGAALPTSAIGTLRALEARIGTSYGLTESSGSVCYAPLDVDDDTLSRSIGRPVPDGEVRLADANGVPVERGAPGEIQVRPEWAMSGYLNRPDANRDVRTADGYVRTGDLGRQDENGCIELIGRLKEMFKSGGYNVYPREVEQAIEEHPDVAACAVVPIAHPLFQEVGVAFVQPAPDRAPQASTLREWCAARLANYKVPKQFRLVDQLPVLNIGKVDRVALRKLAEVSPPVADDAAPLGSLPGWSRSSNIGGHA